MDEWTGRGQGPAVPRYGEEIRCYYGSVCMRCRVAARVHENLLRRWHHASKTLGRQSVS